MVDNIFALGQDAMDASYKRQQGYGQDQARVQAGRKVATGDYAGGAADLYNNGQLDAGSQVQTFAEGQQDWATKQQRDAVAIKAKGLVSIAQGLKGVPEGQRAQKLREIAPVFQQIGVDPSPFMALQEGQLTNDNLDIFAGKVDKQYTMASLGNGGVGAFDPTTGTLKTLREPEYEQKYATVPEGGKLVPIPRGPAPAPGEAPAASATPSAPGATPDASAPRNLRNNNPGNIEDGAFAQSLPGYAGTDGRFAKFSDPGAGTQAQVALLGSYGKRGINTVEGIINRWAPPSDGNDTTGYAKFVAQKIGAQPGQKLDMTDPATLSDIASAIQQFEGGGKATSAKPAQIAQNGDPAGTIYGAPKPREWTSDGKGGLLNINGDHKVDPLAVAAGGAPTGDITLTGPQYLKTIPTARAAQVQAMLDGRMNFPTAFSLKTPYWQSMLADAAQVDPAFDATKFAARSATRTAFTKGVQGQNMVSIQTLLGHIGELRSAIDGLPNTNYPWINAPLNALRVAGGDTKTQAALARMDAATRAVASEAVRTLRGVGGAAADVKGWEKQFDDAKSPADLNSSITTLVSLIGGRLDPLRAQYEQAMGPGADPLLELYPRAAKIYSKLGGEVGSPLGQAPTKSAANGNDPLSQARAAITAGAPRAAVIQRLRQNGIDPSGI